MTSADNYDLHRLAPLRSSHLVVARDQDLRGRLVRDENWNKLGRIRGLVVDPVEGRVRFLEIATGGILGLGRTTSLLPTAAVSHVGGNAVSVRTAPATSTSEPLYDPELFPEPEPVAKATPEIQPARPTYWPYYTADWPYGPGPRPWG